VVNTEKWGLSPFIPLVAAELAEDAATRADPALAPLWELLEEVKDPEIPVVSVRELGVLRALHREEGGLRVVITPTYSGCPAMHAMAEEIRAALAGAGEVDVRIETRIAPAWTTDWIAPEARARLRGYGIAPPPACAGGGEAPARVECPHCGSARTERISEYGSTACKALYRCADCLEPFDHFKPL
jgi:ring-1,2-phenylacetyl-CoA epoxidase subunit PaaD